MNRSATRHRTTLLRRLLSAACLFLAALVSCGPALAEVTAQDLQITARTLGFLDPPSTGTIRMGLLYDAGNSRSAQQAEEVRRLLDRGLAVGNLKLQPVLVDLPDAGGADVHFFFLTDSIGERGHVLQSVLATRKLPCLTTDLEQVRAGICAVGIQSAPKVEIFVNRAAASASNVRFASVFRMMVIEL